MPPAGSGPDPFIARILSWARPSVANGPSVLAAFGAGSVPDQASLPRSATKMVAPGFVSAAVACDVTGPRMARSKRNEVVVLPMVSFFR